jgi:nucleotide-binding universal stress UspA family protein
MRAKRILLPIDVLKCPLEVFELVNSFTTSPQDTVILLYVVDLNIVRPENRANADFHQEAQRFLQRLADRHIHPIVSTLTHVRPGKPAEQILAAAEAESADLIILPTFGPSWCSRLRSVWKPGSSPIVTPLAESVIRAATCAVFLARARTRFDCEKAWGRPVNKRRALVPLTARVSSQAHQPTAVDGLQPLSSCR